MDHSDDTDRRSFEAASMYYLQGETMEAIAKHMGLSRSTVSRLLTRARARGIVTIHLSEPGGAGQNAALLEQEFGVKVRIVPVRDGTTDVNRLRQVAAVAADYLTSLTFPGCTVGTAWGTTMSEVAAALGSHPVPGMTVVQLNGASDPVSDGPSATDVLSAMGSAYSARTVDFPVPAFFDHIATRQAMWAESSVRRVLDVIQRADVAVFGVGALAAALPSQVYDGGHLSAHDQRALSESGVVGDICTVLLRGDGSWRDIELNARATGPTPDQLARIPRRLCIVASATKASALMAALRAQVATDLVVDSATAAALLDMMSRRTR